MATDIPMSTMRPRTSVFFADYEMNSAASVPAHNNRSNRKSILIAPHDSYSSDPRLSKRMSYRKSTTFAQNDTFDDPEEEEAEQEREIAEELETVELKSVDAPPHTADKAAIEDIASFIRSKSNAGFERRESLAWQVAGERGYKLLQGRERYGTTTQAFVKDDINDEGRTRSRRVQYLEGLRGIIGFQTLLWIFFRIFAPAIVVDRDLDGSFPAAFVNNSPQWMNLIRKILSPLLFDGQLQMTMFIILTGRVGLLTFIERRDPLALAGPCFRRPFRLFFPIAITLAMVTIITATNGFKYADSMAAALNNQAARAPVMFTSVLEFFNALATFFFAPTAYKDARAVAFIPPSGISWYLEVIFQQTYVMTVYAWVLPFVTLKYKTIGLIAMIAMTAWVGRWSWYTITGLGIAEFAVVYKQLVFPDQAAGGRRLSIYGLRKNSKIVWVVPSVLVLLGVFFKYLWADALPRIAPNEIRAHADLNAAGLNLVDPLVEAYPRYDNWLLCTGLLLLIEMSPRVQRYLAWKPLAYLGRLSFSIALTSGTIMLSLGSVIYYCLTEALHFTNHATITGILFLIFIPLCLVCAELFSRIVDDASLAISRSFFRFSRS
ncbi:hypothetical protein CBS101457_004908 [Exobasidium rhododendri]|nr:hypothetical protein CBS101457_004908 [Exobasidium rhododendri]